jgi:hypothetical protein
MEQKKETGGRLSGLDFKARKSQGRLFLVLFVERERERERESGCVMDPVCVFIWCHVCPPCTTQLSSSAPGSSRSQDFTGTGGAISNDVFVPQKLIAWGALTHGTSSNSFLSSPFRFPAAICLTSWCLPSQK